MAKECGWTKDYILDNLTLPQLEKYYEVILEEKRKDRENLAVIIGEASAYGAGHLKKCDFEKFLDRGKKKETDMKKSLKEIQKLGIPIEDGLNGSR